MDDLLRDFLTESFENLDILDQELVRFERNPADQEALAKIFRVVHTVKGTCGFLALERLEALAHAAENLLGRFRDGSLTVNSDALSVVLKSIDRIKLILRELEAHEAEPEGDDADLIAALEAAMNAEEENQTADEVHAEAEVPLSPEREAIDELEMRFAGAGESSVASQSIRVGVSLLESLMTTVSELVLTRNQLMQILRAQPESAFQAPLQRLSSLTSELQDGVMKTRMQPIGNAWAKLPRLVRDLAHELHKDINLEMSGSDTELDRQVLELIRDPLVHMVRNAADHGLETPEERRAAGKRETGTIALSARHEGGFIVVELSDDGRGLNTQRISEKIQRLGLASEADVARMSEQQIQHYIFHPGFSTVDHITSVSGRGVGMDVVRSNIEQIGGTIDMKSALGEGCRVTVKIPLTLAIVSALIVDVLGQRYAIPQISVSELVRTRPGSDHRIERLYDTFVLRLRNRLLPLVDLAQVLNPDLPKSSRNLLEREAYIVVSQVGEQSFGICVDHVHDTEEIVVKPTASVLRDVSAFSGNTILGDGSAIMIVDPVGLSAGVINTRLEQGLAHREVELATGPKDQSQSYVLFRAGGKRVQAVALASVARLEEFETGNIEVCDDRFIIQYRGHLMPVMHVDAAGGLRETGRQPVLVVTDEACTIGLAVDEILDIVEEDAVIELGARKPGVLGSATLRGRATEILDVRYFVDALISNERAPAGAGSVPSQARGAVA